jgi:AcrR family transcriptional regulator
LWDLVARKNSRTARGPHQLPPGRHGLSRSFVARNQRQRILAAVAEATSERGYARMSVEDVVRGAGVSRRTFYELFANKEQVFLEAYDQVAHLLVAAVRAANESEKGFANRVTAGFRVFLELLEASPAFARMCVVEVMAAGPEAVAKRTAVMGEFAKLLEDNARTELDHGASVPAMHAQTIVAGAYEAVYRMIAAGEVGRLSTLLPDLVESALLPYIGEEEAAAHRLALARELEEGESTAAGTSDDRTAGASASAE